LNLQNEFLINYLNQTKTMLKKKIQSLVAQGNLGEQSNFEIIHDSSAAQILGGGTCPKLENCNLYSGDCPNLTTCGTYTPPA